MQPSRGAALLSGLLLVILALGAAAHAVAKGHSPQAGPDLMRSGDRMSLGTLRDSSETPPSAEPLRRRERCRRWRELALGLGETFAGYSLRTGLVTRHCALLEALESRHASAWNWPWTAVDTVHALPPRLLRRFGDWEIRCGEKTERMRCALILQAPAKLGGAADHPSGISVTTHFVIDQVAGREVLLWRLFVPARSRDSLQIAAEENASGADGKSMAAVRDGSATADKAPSARLRIGLRRQSLRFTMCKAGGCMLEVGGARAGRIATRLAAGRVLPIDLAFDGLVDLRIEVSAGSFADGLAELMRLRRLERQQNAPR